jgi:predicted nucleotidyltransferase component of viral defense system
MIHLNIISEELKEIIVKISNDEVFHQFRLGGGTALALQLGHRISVDADFISDKDFNRNEINNAASRLLTQVTDMHWGPHGIFLKSNNIKVDFLTWNIPFIRPQIRAEEFRLLHIEEIAAMKIFAILQRGEKKDYFDIAVLLQHYSLQQIISFYTERHKNSDAALVLRFLASHSDIDNQPDPIMLNEMNWTQCKNIIAQAINSFLRQE